MTPLIVSYYTLGTGYEKEAKNLIASCKKLELQTDIVGIPTLGKWEENCCYKPRFLLSKLAEHQRPLVWVDADAIFLKPPELFETLTEDLAARLYEDLPLEHPSKLITGTLFIQHSERVKTLLSAWNEECQRLLEENKGEVWDQIALKNVLLRDSSYTLAPLPDAYCAIFDKKMTPKKDVVILHYQASRLYKKVVNQEVIPFWEEDMFSQENRSLFSP